MYVSEHDISTPPKTLLGNAAWLLLHTAPYQATTIEASELTDEERDMLPHVAFAARYAMLAESVVAAYPCKECRQHAMALRGQLRSLKQYASGLVDRPDVSPDDVADELAIAAFRLHNRVNAAANATNVYALPEETAQIHRYLKGVQDRTLAGLEQRVTEGTLSERYLAIILRARWLQRS